MTIGGQTFTVTQNGATHMRLHPLPNQCALQRLSAAILPSVMWAIKARWRSQPRKQLFLECHEQCFVDNDYIREFRYRRWNGYLFRIRQYNGKHQDRNHDHWRTDLHRYTEWRHTQNDANTPLYFPHVDTSLPWQTEIAIINTGDQTVTGTLKAFSDDGQLVETKAVTLSARGRRQIIVANEFTNHTDIGYIIFDTDSAAVQGYTKFYQDRDLSGGNPCGQRGEHLGHLYLAHRLRR